MCMPQSNIIFFPPTVTITQLFPTSCPAPATEVTHQKSGEDARILGWLNPKFAADKMCSGYPESPTLRRRSIKTSQKDRDTNHPSLRLSQHNSRTKAPPTSLPLLILIPSLPQQHLLQQPLATMKFSTGYPNQTREEEVKGSHTKRDTPDQHYFWVMGHSWAASRTTKCGALMNTRFLLHHLKESINNWEILNLVSSKLVSTFLLQF